MVVRERTSLNDPIRSGLDLYGIRLFSLKTDNFFSDTMSLDISREGLDKLILDISGGSRIVDLIPEMGLIISGYNSLEAFHFFQGVSDLSYGPVFLPEKRRDCAYLRDEIDRLDFKNSQKVCLVYTRDSVFDID